jgi:hypothetical protein
MACILAGVGAGALVKHRSGTIFDRGLIGYAVLAAIALFLHFWLPGWICGGCVLAFAAFASCLAWQHQIAFLRAQPLSDAIIGFALLIGIWWHATKSALNYDMGLYYIQASKWTSFQPLLPGLANLHERFGFDSLIHSLGGLTLTPLVGVASIDVGFHAIVWLCLGRLLSELFRVRVFSRAWLAGVPFLGACALRPSFLNIGAPTPDFASAAIGVLMIFYFLKDAEGEQDAALLCLIAAVLGAVVRIQLFAFLGLILILWRRRKPRPLCVVPLLLLAIWFLRNIGLSGCIVYPIAVTCLTVPWAAGANVAASSATNIRHWATTHMSLPSGSADVALIFGCLLSAAVAFKSRSFWRPCFWPVVFGSVYAIAIFAGAPDFRFVLAIVLISISAFAAGCLGSVAGARPAVARWMGVGLLALAFGTELRSGLPNSQWPRIPTPSTHLVSTAVGVINEPTVGDQCWDAPLPCSPGVQGVGTAWLQREFVQRHILPKIAPGKAVVSGAVAIERNGFRTGQ